jgi:hypothetical protein
MGRAFNDVVVRDDLIRIHGWSDQTDVPLFEPWVIKDAVKAAMDSLTTPL